ncbi:hypothetical protein J6590_072008 [Homalodisca vitripennis]|nr:hypothetical protein J6590_072008 [Homalodisca vitripennis]
MLDSGGRVGEQRWPLVAIATHVVGRGHAHRAAILTVSTVGAAPSDNSTKQQLFAEKENPR